MSRHKTSLLLLLITQCFISRLVAEESMKELPLSLSELIRIGLANNPGISAKRYNIETAEARLGAASGTALPKIDAAFGYNYFLDDQRLIPATSSASPGVLTHNIVSGDIVMRIPLFTGGRISSEISAADFLLKAEEHSLAHTQEELLFNITSVYYGILARRKVVESLEFSVNTLKEHLKRIEDMVAVEKAANVDRLRTEVRLASLNHRMIKEKNNLVVMHKVLSNFLGINNSTGTIEIEGNMELQAKNDLLALPDYLDIALEKRQDYKSSLSLLSAQSANMDTAKAARLPSVYFTSSYGYRWALSPVEQPAGTNNLEDVGRVGIVMDIPIFDGNRIREKIKEEKSKLGSLKENLNQLKLRISLEVETAVSDILSAGEQLESVKKAEEQAKETFRIEQLKYELGKGAIIDVLDAQSALLEVQTAYYQALAEYNTSLARLRFVIGELL